MGFLDKLKFKSTFDDEDIDEYGDDYEEVEDEEEEEEAEAPKAAPVAKPAPAAKPQAKPAPARGAIDGSAIELKVVKPDTFGVVPQIADQLLNRRTVVLNLENASKEDCRRLIDFLSGVAYAIDGHLSKVAANTYLITPANVNISGQPLSEGSEDEEEKAED